MSLARCVQWDGNNLMEVADLLRGIEWSQSDSGAKIFCEGFEFSILDWILVDRHGGVWRGVHLSE